MTFLIAAAGTGGHVFPGLSVGEGLIDLGIPQDEILYVGGDRLESQVYPDEGYRFIQVELAGLQRSMTLANARIPAVVVRARRSIVDIIESAGIEVVLGMGGYVTIPAALAARSEGVPFFNAEQNAEAGLANKVTARWAVKSFVSFPDTGGLPNGSWVGNPVRRPFWEFDRERLRPAALDHYDLTPGTPVIGVFGGSLGAGALNDAVAKTVATWDGRPLHLVHLTGAAHEETLAALPSPDAIVWRRVGFEDRMEHFYAVCDLVIARAGGAVAEITATGTPSVLVPGQFGSGGHQEGNARFLAGAGAAVILPEEDLGRLPALISELTEDDERREQMARATGAISKPDAARTIARAMIEAAP
jgi:UDP-N-acetylglucosamine--N-acetylmuramyl-(pentapeptide) pyrophosphoryl-undecaprenol N-acetylglucosamine transferase